jgi:hypothetical protein
MKGSPAKLGTIQGTSGHRSALKKAEQDSLWEKMQKAGRGVKQELKAIGKGIAGAKGNTSRDEWRGAKKAYKREKDRQAAAKKRRQAAKKDSPLEKSYKEAYKGADKKKYDTYEKFEKAAKAWNVKKYGTAEPTKESKKLVGKHKGAYVSGDKPEDYVTTKGAKRELAARHQAKTQTTAALEADKKRSTADIKSGKARKIVSSVTGKEAVDYRKTEPKTKKRSKVGKALVSVGNIFRKKGKKVNPYRKTVKSNDSKKKLKK